MKKSCRKCASKASPRSLFYFGKQPKTAIGCKKFFQNRYSERGLLKPFKKLHQPMQDNSWHHKLFYFHFHFWIWKWGKEAEKLHKVESLGNEKCFLDETKNIFQFLMGYHLVKKKFFDKK